MALIENTDGRLESREQSAAFGIDFQNADRFNLDYGAFYELLPAPFRIAPGVTLPAGGYRYGDVRIGFTRAQLHRVSGSATLEHGTFYNGDKTTFGVSSGRVNLATRFSVARATTRSRAATIMTNCLAAPATGTTSWTARPASVGASSAAADRSIWATAGLAADVMSNWEPPGVTTTAPYTSRSVIARVAAVLVPVSAGRAAVV